MLLFLEDGPETFDKNNDNVINIDIGQKNHISILYQLQNGLRSEIMEQIGPNHCPIFKARIELGGQFIYGTGKSKKEAKVDAFREATKWFIQFSNISDNQKSTTEKGIKVTSSDFLKQNNTHIQKRQSNKNTKTPLEMFNALYPNTEFTCVCNQADPHARFKMTIKVGNETFQGTGN